MSDDKKAMRQLLQALIKEFGLTRHLGDEGEVEYTGRVGGESGLNRAILTVELDAKPSRNVQYKTGSSAVLECQLGRFLGDPCYLTLGTNGTVNQVKAWIADCDEDAIIAVL